MLTLEGLREREQALLERSIGTGSRHLEGLYLVQVEEQNGRRRRVEDGSGGGGRSLACAIYLRPRRHSVTGTSREGGGGRCGKKNQRKRNAMLVKVLVGASCGRAHWKIV